MIPDAILLLGPTGSGKTPLGGELERRGWNGCRCAHFDFGAELRRAVSDTGSFPDLAAEERESLRSVLEAGALLENHRIRIALKILDGFLREKDLRGGDLLILNGLPRHKGQARDLEGRVRVRAVVRLLAGEETLLERLTRDPAGDRAGRSDDSADEIRRKIELFEKRTRPLVEYYRSRGVPVFEISVSSSETGADLRKEFDRKLAQFERL